MSPVKVREVSSPQDLDRFVRLPFGIYDEHPNWVAPLVEDVKNALTPGKNPFWNHAERKLFLAEKGDVAVGRIAATVDRNYNDYHRSAIGFFGFFETAFDSEVPPALFEAACAFCRGKGMKAVYGPANPSLNDESGLLVSGHDSPPMIRMSYNPEFYAGMIEAAGFTKVKDLHAYEVKVRDEMPPKFERVMKKLKTKPGVVVRPANLKRLKDDLEIIKEIYNDAWSRNWDFAPMTSAEIDQMARQLRPLIIPDLCPIVFLHGEPAAMSVALPDYNQILHDMGGSLFPFGWLRFLSRRRRITQGRLWALGVKSRFRNLGFDSLLYYESFAAARRLGYTRGEVSWILEDNVAIIRPILQLGGKLYKTYRIYQRSLV